MAAAPPATAKAPSATSQPPAPMRSTATIAAIAADSAIIPTMAGANVDRSRSILFMIFP